MSEIIIRKVVESDKYSISNNIFTRDTLDEVEEQLKKSINEMKEGRRIHLVAVNEDNVVGNIEIVKEQHILYSHRCIVGDMIVNPEFQHKGVARRLFEEGCKLLSKLNCSYVMTTCRGNGTENFYKALGMIECGRIPNGIYEPWGDKRVYDEVILYKDLGTLNIQ